jgi:hypothetical protein
VAAVVAGWVAWVAGGGVTGIAMTPPPETLFASAVVGAFVDAVVVGAAVALGAAVVAERVVGAAVVGVDVFDVVDVAVFAVVVGAVTHTNCLFTFVHLSVDLCTTAVLFAPTHAPPTFGAFADAGFAFPDFDFGAAYATFDARQPMMATAVAATKVRVTVRFVIRPA